MADNAAVDVNGKRIRTRSILTIAGNLSRWEGIDNLEMIDLEYTQTRLVNYIGISLPGDPELANTTEEYQKTAIYESIALLIGSSCPDLSADYVYKFFQNTVKPKIIREDKTTTIDETHADTSYFHKALDIPFCGHKLSYTRLFGYSTDDISLDNPKGVYSRVSVSFK